MTYLRCAPWWVLHRGALRVFDCNVVFRYVLLNIDGLFIFLFSLQIFCVFGTNLSLAVGSGIELFHF